jgi:hypothetical protein
LQTAKQPTHDNGWQCVDGMMEPKWLSGDFIPQQLADVLVEENIAGLTESDESDDEFDDVLYSLIDGEEDNHFGSIIPSTHCQPLS